MSDFNSSPDTQEVFILRVWKSQDNEASLRGHIQHVRSGQILPIHEPNNILDFIQEQVKVTKKKSTPSKIK